MLKDRNIIVAVTGGIAAYKACELCSQLRKEGAAVRVAMTAAATRFVSPLTFETLCQHPVYLSVLERPGSWEMEHISWAKWADALVIAPASANTIARLAAGFADDPVTTLYLTFRGSVLVAPAMNTAMLEHPATLAAMETLRRRGAVIVDPGTGLLACGDKGRGKLAAVEDILAAVRNLPFGLEKASEPAAASSSLAATAVHSSVPEPAPAEPAPSVPTDSSLAGRTVLVTSGPTHEFLDPVRFLTNPSSGKMGGALAQEAARRGAIVHLVTGPVAPSVLPPTGVQVHKVISAEQMLTAVRALAQQVDIFVFCAAVSDFRVVSPPTQKIKRTGNALSLTLIENPDIAQAVGVSKRPGQITVGFAAETNDLEGNATAKMHRKHLDAIVANDVANPRIGFEQDENEVTIYLRTGEKRFVPRSPKATVAREVFEAVLGLPAEK
jgi:phosphopantothenoylcysteine decarboxylase/phosphopantothenate--cysteine ligase